MQFKDEAYAAQSPFEVRFSDEADLEMWERGRGNDDRETAPSILQRPEARHGPTYLRLTDPGRIVSVSDEPRALSLETIAEVIRVDSAGVTSSP